jgi:valyl-tRNA synthetase
MHPNDARYKDYTHGQKLTLEWINGPIEATVIKDEAADMEFGSGVMTITPSHSGIDYEIAKRHNLDIEQVIDERGILLPIAGQFAGQHIKKARPMIVEHLQTKGLIVKIDEGYTHNVATNERGGGVIEPQIKKQWFINVNKEFVLPHSEIPGIESGATVTLKEIMRKAVDQGGVKILPDRFEKIYFHWIDNLRDWNISRQIWFGHRIPAWSKDGETKVQIESPGEGWEQDPDVLDTWFSSGLWTMTTLGWPDDTADFRTYHPTSVLETGYDIIFFWVARMILMSGFLVGQVPFRHVYLHGLVRDGQGRKMSKSLGNIIDPLEMAEKYGADATRLSLIFGVQIGNDQKLSEDRIRGFKNFANKVWNITRFVLENTSELDENATLVEADTELIREANRIAQNVTDHIESFRLDIAADTVYHYVWDRFAAEILEESKPIFKGEDETAKKSRERALYEILTISIRLLHPMMPFVTETIWQHLPHKSSDQLMVAKWPTVQ